MSESGRVGRVVQVNISSGGVPKVPVEGPVRVGRFGLEGDGHSEPTVHGGPHRAVALFATEAIRRVQAEGHPIFPGSCGENLTTEGLELAMLPIGTRLAVGSELVLELSSPDGPCVTIRDSFSDGRFARISILTNPTDSRMYARVVAEGPVRAGDPIHVLETAADPRAIELAMVARVEAARRAYWVANWRATEAGGIDIRIVDDGELAMAATPGFPGAGVNQALGLDLLPNLLPEALDFFTANGVDGWVHLEPGDVPPGVPEDELSPATVYAMEPDRVRGPAVGGLSIRELAAAEDGVEWARLLLAADPEAGPTAERVERMAPHLLGTPRQAHRRLFVAALEDRPVAAAALYTHRKVGWMAAAGVLPGARGRGIQRALLAHRAAAAAEAGCDLVALDAAPDEPSARNALGSGLVPIGSRVMLRAALLAGSPVATRGG